jgi:aldehyde:ferredoxin oxidoreductase
MSYHFIVKTMRRDKGMFGYNGRLLRVNLNDEKISVEELPEDYYKRYLGGRGFIATTLLQEVPRGADPYGPENRLIFALGPITGMPMPGSGRNSVGAKSPLTGGFGEAEAGGFFGAELKKAGYDAIIVEGTAKSPLYLWIKDGKAELRDARHLWGRETRETQQEIRRELGDPLVRTAVIGPAGKNGCVSPASSTTSPMPPGALDWERLWAPRN